VISLPPLKEEASGFGSGRRRHKARAGRCDDGPGRQRENEQQMSRKKRKEKKDWRPLERGPVLNGTVEMIKGTTIAQDAARIEAPSHKGNRGVVKKDREDKGLTVICATKRSAHKVQQAEGPSVTVKKGPPCGVNLKGM